jgi:uncharacterized protein YjbJ (UPF0337 family)
VNDDHVKGKMEELKGNVKQRVGGATKDRKMEGEGFVEEQKGKLRQGVGNLKDKAKELKERHEERQAERRDESEDVERK